MSYKNNKVNPMGGDTSPSTSVEDVDAQIYGRVDAPSSGRVVAKPVALTAIAPDLRQPRRAIPASVRGNWNGDPLAIGDLLTEWKIKAQMLTGDKLMLLSILTGADDLPVWEADKAPQIAVGFAELVSLAADIYRSGLQNPITIYRWRDGYRVLTGERRLLAHHLLYHYVDRERFEKIPAREVAYDVRQQISENTQRRDLNAIGMARCYAMIVMQLYAEQGETFEEYESLVAPGEVDRVFYAQVAERQIPYGKSQDVMGALNVKSRQSVANYRDLLTLSDSAWQEADEMGWSLRACLELMDKGPNVQRVGHSADENVKRVSHFDTSTEKPRRRVLTREEVNADPNLPNIPDDPRDIPDATPTLRSRKPAGPVAGESGHRPGQPGRERVLKKDSGAEHMLSFLHSVYIHNGDTDAASVVLELLNAREGDVVPDARALYQHAAAVLNNMFAELQEYIAHVSGEWPDESA